MSEVDAAQAAIEGLRAADPNRDYLVISHSVDRSLHHKLSRLLAAKQKHEKVTVFLTTFGGDPNGGYRAARCLRHHYKHVRLAVPSYCKSAGTLIAIAANELAIGDLGELGPLDIQVRKGSELSEQSSGLDIMQALQAVTSHTQDAFHKLMIGTRGYGLSTKLCAEFAAAVSAGIAAPLISQIDPIRLGEMQRATRVAYEYGERLNAYAGNLRPGALQRLVGQYPAHGFVIDRKEANELFVNVTKLNDAEIAFSAQFWSVLELQGTIDPEMIEFQPQAPEGDHDEQVTAQATDEGTRNGSGVDDGAGNPDPHGPDPAGANGQSVRVRPRRNRQPAPRRA